MLVRSLLVVLVLFGCANGGARADSPGRLAPTQGMLLVAAEEMADPRFAGSVVLLIDYGPDGVTGLIVNRPTRVTLDTAFGGALDFGDRGRHLYFGGPLATGSVTTLLRAPAAPAGSRPIVDGLYLLQVERLDAELRRSADEDRLRVFSGYAGWTTGQLAGEIARGDWYVLPCDAAVLFTTPPERLWETLRKRGGEIWI